MKKIFKFAAIVAATAALFSCQEKPEPTPTPDPDKPNQEQPETPQINENIKFTLTLGEITENTAKFRVEHDGARTDTWHYFATTESDIAAAIEAEAAALAEAGKAPQASTGKNVTVRGLEPETEYTFVVFGVTKTGEVYGEPATLPFKTAAEQVAVEGYQINPAWTIEYIGEYQGYDNVVYVESTDDNTYFTAAWPKDYYEQTSIEEVVMAEIQGWVDYFPQSGGMTWNDVLVNESSLSIVGIDPEYGTEWYIIAIGADYNGNPTGLYAHTLVDLANLGGGDDDEDDTEPTPEYAAWLGDWTFTGANGVAWSITFSKGKTNESYIMTGWELQADLPVEVLWDAENGIWAAMIQNLGTYEFEGGENGDIWFVAFEGKNFYPVEDIPAILGGYNEDGTRIAIGYEPQDESGNTIVFDKAGFVASIGGSWYTITGVKDFPTYPITITPATKATQHSVKEFKGSKKTYNPFAPKTFKTYGLCEMSYRTF